MDELREMDALDLKSVLNTLSKVNSARPCLETSSITPSEFGPRFFDPPGNFYAAGIKNIQDDSQSIFPESIFSNISSRRKRWMSTYDKDYIPRQEEEYDQWLDEYMDSVSAINVKPCSAPAFVGMRSMASPMKMNEPIRAKDQLQITDKEKMFMSWKVPNRLTSDESTSRLGSRLRQLEEQQIVHTTPRGENTKPPSRQYKEHTTAIISSRVAATVDKSPPTPAQLRQISQSATPRLMKATPRMRESVTPRVLENATPRFFDNATPRPGQTPFQCETPTADGLYVRKQPTPYKTKTYRTQELFKQYENVCQYSTLQDFLHTASHHDKRLVERTLKMIYNKNSNSQEAVRNVQRWLDKASDDDRKVALNFFSSIGVQMMGSATPQERQVVHKVISLLKDHPGRNPYNNPHSLQRSRTDVGQPKQDSSLQYVRLLTPGTRGSRWQQQTWHHLPVYNQTNPVNNDTAIYTQAGRVPHRHWNIHPDWELKTQS